jgi:uncharacterized DUF497 family protein
MYTARACPVASILIWRSATASEWNAGNSEKNVAFTIRGELIRVISVRDMTRFERRIYEEAIQDDKA